MAAAAALTDLKQVGPKDPPFSDACKLAAAPLPIRTASVSERLTGQRTPDWPAECTAATAR